MHKLQSIFCILICALIISTYNLCVYAASNIGPIPRDRPNLTQPQLEPSPQQIFTPKLSYTVPTPRPRPDASQQVIVKQDASTSVVNNDEELLKQLSAAYSSVQTMRANFVQISGESYTSGKLTLSKPGKFHFAYNAPSTIDIISDGKTVLVRDKKLRTNDTYPLDQTPLRILLLSKIDLTKDVRVVNIVRREEVIEIQIDESKSALQSQLTLYFSKKNFELLQWTILDAQGVETNIALTSIENNIPIDQNQFKIDVEAIRQDGGAKGN